MAEEANLSINVNIGGGWSSDGSKSRKSMSRKEWVQQRRENKRARQDEDPAPTSPQPSQSVSETLTTGPTSPPAKIANKVHPPARPRHPENKATTSKFSALFTKNPDIPSVKSSDVKPKNEKVFTGDSFKDLDLHTFMVDNLEKKLGFSQMTEVQKASIPHVMDGRDVLIKSQTGSGKTIAYAVPIVQELQARSPKITRADGTFAIVIVPTRELAIQSCQTFTDLTRPFTWVVPGSLIGGEKRKAQKARLRKGINVVVTTPGRLLDHLKHTQSLSPAQIKWLVIDEADRLLDLGFEKEVREIISCLNEKQTQHRQTILLSATLSAGVEQLAGMSLHDPLRISVSHGTTEISNITATQTTTHTKPSTASDNPTKSSPKQPAASQSKTNPSEEERDETFATPSSLDHECVVVPSKLRLVTLAAILLSKCKFSRRPCKMLVFFSTQDLVEFHHRVFSRCLREDSDDSDPDEDGDQDEKDTWLFKLHGDMDQKDVASRGLDLPHVEWIIQFQPPTSCADYIHRVGRTARAGSAGQALLFLTPAEVDFIKVLNDQNISLKTVDMQEYLTTLQKLVLRLISRQPMHKSQLPRRTEECAIALQTKMETYVDGQSETRTLARKAYQSFVRAYATYPSALRHIFNLKNVHLGHVAKSFCLADAPKSIGAIVGMHAPKPKKHKRNNLFEDESSPTKKPKLQKKRQNAFEFDSGLDGVSACAMPKKFTKTKKSKKKVKIR